MTAEEYNELREEWEYHHMVGCECDPDIYDGGDAECEYCEGEYWLDWEEWLQSYGPDGM